MKVLIKPFFGWDGKKKGVPTILVFQTNFDFFITSFNHLFGSDKSFFETLVLIYSKSCILAKLFSSSLMVFKFSSSSSFLTFFLQESYFHHLLVSSSSSSFFFFYCFLFPFKCSLYFIHWIHLFFNLSLNSLFKQTSNGYSMSVKPPGITATVVLSSLDFSFTASVMWARNKSHTNINGPFSWAHTTTSFGISLP